MPLSPNFHVHFQGVEPTLEGISAAAAELLTPVVVANVADAADTWLAELRRACNSKQKRTNSDSDHPTQEESATSDPLTFLWIANHALRKSCLSSASTLLSIFPLC